MKNNNTVDKNYVFSDKAVSVYFDATLAELENHVDRDAAVLITDENVFQKQRHQFEGWKTVVIKAGEQHKNQQTVDGVIDQLIAMNADRQTFLVGVGGGVVTDIAGYAASIYMRGIRFGFVPTTILGMVDASIGGKNGVDVGVYKNLVGVINHPQFLLYDYSFLETLPRNEWVNGFAEIIKHACIKDESMFRLLEDQSLDHFYSSLNDTGLLIQRNVGIKYDVVVNDERETGERKLLNFGHTIGHAIENTARLPHGSAISIGMVAACLISEKVNGFASSATERIRTLLSDYHLPVSLDIDREKAWNVLLHDKKKSGQDMNFVVLDTIGCASIKKIPIPELRDLFFSFNS